MDIIKNDNISIETKIDDKYNDKECVICYDNEDGINKHWVQLQCGHQYHQLCIDQWIVKRNVCPICIRTVYDDNEINKNINNYINHDTLRSNNCLPKYTTIIKVLVVIICIGILLGIIYGLRA